MPNLDIVTVLIVITIIVFKAPCYKWLVHVLHYVEIYIFIIKKRLIKDRLIYFYCFLDLNCVLGLRTHRVALLRACFTHMQHPCYCYSSHLLLMSLYKSCFKKIFTVAFSLNGLRS